MLTAASVILPVIAIIALGFFLVRMTLFTPDQNTALNKFVFMIAAPALLFRNVAITEFPETTPWGALVVLLSRHVWLHGGVDWPRAPSPAAQIRG